MTLTEIYKDMQGTRVATPGPTPVPSRSSSRSSSPAANLGRIDFGSYETPAKKAAASVVLSPVFSEGSGGSSASLDVKMPGVPSNKMCLIVGKFSTGDPVIIQKIENLPSGIKGVVQIEDCTCVLLGNKKVVPVAFMEKGYLYGQKPQTNQVDDYVDVGETIEDILSCCSWLLAIGTSGKLHLLKYRSGTGTFDKPLTFSMDVTGGVALGQTSVFGFGRELLDRGSLASLQVVPLDAIAVATSQDDALGEATQLQLPQLRTRVKLASGRDPTVLLAFDQRNNGKLYTVKGGKLVKVSIIIRKHMDLII